MVAIIVISERQMFTVVCIVDNNVGVGAAARGTAASSVDQSSLAQALRVERTTCAGHGNPAATRNNY
jgi:hypothetical protein